MVEKGNCISFVYFCNNLCNYGLFLNKEEQFEYFYEINNYFF